MDKKRIRKLALLNAGIALVNIVVFSPGLLHIRLTGAGIFNSALGGAVIFMSIAAFALGNYRLINKEEKKIQPAEIKTVEDCVNALRQNGKKTFAGDTETILEQISRFQKKKESLNSILLQKFNNTEMSFTKFQNPILDVENVFFLNIKSILNKISAFDEEDYDHIMKDGAQTQFSKEVLDSKMSIFNEYLTFVKSAIEYNEEILLKLDKVLLEISKFNSLDPGEIANMDAMKEIDELIKNTKLYK